jgi:predicted DNA-binding transcriptional regulator AlpA
MQTTALARMHEHRRLVGHPRPRRIDEPVIDGSFSLHEVQHALESVSVRVLLRLPIVIQATGLGRSTIYKLVAEKKFPAPARLNPPSEAVTRDCRRE